MASAFSPGSVGNVGVGFDILGHAIAGIGDIAHVRRIDEPVVRIAAIRGTVTDLPLQPERNTAGMALISLRQVAGVPFGFELRLDQSDEARARFGKGHRHRQHLRQRDEAGIADDQIDGLGNMVGGQDARARLFEDDHALVLPQFPRQLVGARIHRIDARRTAA